jgi:hypothetical protein
MTDKETSASANTVAASTANPPPAPPAAEAIEEDDEFEEFEPCHWDKRDEDAEDSQQWQVSRLFMLYYLLTSYYLLFIYVLRCTSRRRYCKIGYDYQQNGCFGENKSYYYLWLQPTVRGLYCLFEGFLP